MSKKLIASQPAATDNKPVKVAVGASSSTYGDMSSYGADGAYSYGGGYGSSSYGYGGYGDDAYGYGGGYGDAHYGS